MRTITIEEHFLAEGFIAAMRGQGPRDGTTDAFVAEREVKLADLGEIRLRDMDESGINVQVISHTAQVAPGSRPPSETVNLVRQANDQLAAAVTVHPTRFAGFAALPLIDPAAASDELERAVRMLGFKGALINGTTEGKFLDHPVFLPVLERAVALDVPIYVHPAPPPAPVWESYYSGFDPAVSLALATAGWGWHSEVGIHALRLILSGVFDRLPSLQIIIGHMGEMLPFMLARIQDRFSAEATRLQHPVPEYLLRNFHITTSGFFTDPPLLLALQILGADRIIFSVDYPYSSNQQGRRFLDSAAISPEDKEKITHRNVERLLKL
jgi:uncharacterized protein